MKVNLLKKTAMCLLAGAFLAGSVYAASKEIGKNSDIFGDKNVQKQDKTTPVTWSGTITITSDAAGKPTAANFTNSQDKKQYNIQIDDNAKKLLANIKTGNKVQIKGSLLVKASGTSSVKLTECTAVPE